MTRSAHDLVRRLTNPRWPRSLVLAFQDSDESRRLDTVVLLGRLFSSHVDMTSVYHTHFREFLQRCRDKDVNVREAVVSAAATIMQHKPDCAEECAGTSFGEERRLCSFAECILRIFFWPELTVCMILAHGWLCCCSGVEDAGRRP